MKAIKTIAMMLITILTLSMAQAAPVNNELSMQRPCIKCTTDSSGKTTCVKYKGKCPKGISPEIGRRLAIV